SDARSEPFHARVFPAPRTQVPATAVPARWPGSWLALRVAPTSAEEAFRLPAGQFAAFRSGIRRGLPDADPTAGARGAGRRRMDHPKLRGGHRARGALGTGKG